MKGAPDPISGLLLSEAEELPTDDVRLNVAKTFVARKSLQTPPEHKFRAGSGLFGLFTGI